MVVYQVKDTIFWKQITTTLQTWQSVHLLFIKSKIQFFESKSQLDWFIFKKQNCCLSSQRYNFLKANHNQTIDNNISFGVVYQVKDTIFWKQITTIWRSGICIVGCLSSQRYNFLKANHNNWSILFSNVIVVYQVKDTIFWKQITTIQGVLPPRF